MALSDYHIGDRVEVLINDVWLPGTVEDEWTPGFFVLVNLDGMSIDAKVADEDRIQRLHVGTLRASARVSVQGPDGASWPGTVVSVNGASLTIAFPHLNNQTLVLDEALCTLV